MIRGLLRTSDACKAAFEIARRSARSSRLPVRRNDTHKAPTANVVSKAFEPAKPVSPAGPRSRHVEAAAALRDVPSALPYGHESLASAEDRSIPYGTDALHQLIPQTASQGSEPRHPVTTPSVQSVVPTAQMRSSAVPSSRFGRLFQYGGLAIGVGLGTARAALSNQKHGSTPLYFSEANIRRIVNTLSRMRGAALKVGQFLSIQDSKMLPPEVVDILSRVQNAADYMPWWQTESLLVEELGPQWRDNFALFDQEPIAAASIGQVHKATLNDGTQVAVKVQFPGIADSINADIGYLKSLLTMSFILPPGLFLGNSLKVLSSELHDECDYIREADSCMHFKSLLERENVFAVPSVHKHLSTSRILTLDYMSGVPLKSLRDASQPLRDYIGSLVVKLCLKEMFEFRFMQTDPNWSNFLWNQESMQLEIIDFGASRAYSQEFADLYKDMLLAAIADDRTACEAISRQLRFIVNDDVPAMVNAHIDSVMALAEPFRVSNYDFGEESITSRVRSQIPIMLQHRRTPPPKETYSLNRKLSGCFLLCANLRSRIDCAKILSEVV